MRIFCLVLIMSLGWGAIHAASDSIFATAIADHNHAASAQQHHHEASDSEPQTQTQGHHCNLHACSQSVGLLSYKDYVHLSISYSQPTLLLPIVSQPSPERIERPQWSMSVIA